MGMVAVLKPTRNPLLPIDAWVSENSKIEGGKFSAYTFAVAFSSTANMSLGSARRV